MGPPSAAAGIYSYKSIQTYQDNGAFNPEDLALSDIPDDLVATALREEWALPEDSTRHVFHPDDLFIPDKRDDSDADIFDSDYHPSSSSPAILPNGAVKKGRPCAKPQTEERKRVNQRRMEGYYRRKHDQGNLEKARQQSKESYYRRKQRRIEAGEKVRSYNAPRRGRSDRM